MPRRHISSIRNSAHPSTALVALVIALLAALFASSLEGAVAEAGARKVRYGPGIAADSLNNTVVGGSTRQQVSYRFRASTTARLSSITVYMINGPSGYSGGNGGTIRVTVRPDNRKPKHRPASKVLARQTIPDPPSRADVTIRFRTPPRLINGRLYHIVFENRDSRPGVNYASLNGLFVFDEMTRWQPAFDNRDWAQLVKNKHSAWTASRGSGHGTITPIMALGYSNGKRTGMGYMEVWSPAPRTISDGARVRERFTVSGKSRRVSRIVVRLKRVSGSSPLRITLKRQGGKTVALGEVPASAIERGTASSLSGSSWATLRLSRPILLRHGKSYTLMLTTAGGTRYSIHAIRQGSRHGYPKDSYFKDGQAEYSNGSGWHLFGRWGRSSKEADLQFYFK